MQGALHIKTTVLPGRRIEIAAPQLIEGEAVDVFLVLPETAGAPRRTALEIIRGLKGHRLFQSPDEADQHLQQERNAWDR
jgi:hypothetical protein